MRLFYLLISVILSWVLCLPSTHELQTSQSQVLLQLRKHLEYPSSLEIWENYYGDFCNLSSSAHMSISCQDDSVTELKIMGDKLFNVNDFNGFAIPNHTLSESFSIDSFVTTLSRLPSLRVLSLVSLGIWGPLSDKIHRLSSLEFLDLSSNFIFGSVPPKISTMVKLHTLTLEDNYFNDTVPDWLDSLSNLTILSLKNNRLKGRFPSSICRIKTLTVIALSNNELSGNLPDMDTLISLRVLDLRENHIDSELPMMPQGLVTALLSKNSFSGEIPAQFGHLGQLQHLDLSFNYLSGTPPSALFSLPNISYLNLASNMLSGAFPDQLNCGGKLGFVDISNNKLTGDLPSCLSSTSNERVVEFNGNCFSIDSQHQHQASYCKEALASSKQSGGRETVMVVGVISGAVLVLVLLAFAVLSFRRRYRSRTFEHNIFAKAVPDNSPNGFCSELIANARFISEAAKLETHSASVSRIFSLEQLKEATNNFDLSMFLGEGSMGKLYKGKLENGTYVAIRFLTILKKYSIQNLKVRLDFLSKLHHPHLVGLLGYCIDSGGQDDSSGNRIFLINEYVSSGNYRTYLSENCPEKVLKWSDRLAILIGVAKAVHFLHTGVIPGCFNNRLKTNNILLDEHRIAKLSDYGMSIITEESEKLEAKGEGTKSWNSTNMEGDVYNFGFILLESLVGPIVSGKGETFLLNEMASFGSQDGRRKIVDPIVLTTCSQESLSIVVSITKKCTCPEVSARPSFEDVLWNLQYAAQVQATADADQRSDSTS
ncbi:PREDICTED: probable inactive leucine-rich repeat receptor-like protein kinase At3g03770 [Prunus mume]|uniref:Probable inactive leucine-rich repeat receptor-like protein kinase At3g03770 n=1 Tax=Prunus mume TaxID=102107 RepID=A0ABM0NX80_PRUMU|nr:PREDICTED: probable inactive leucine-rich repeat receptor-like protein kinase At3g03770 [Prunus mume]